MTEQAVNIERDDEMIAISEQPRDGGRGHRRDPWRGGLKLVLTDPHDLRDGIDDQSNRSRLNIDDHHAGLLVERLRGHAKFGPEIDHRQNGPTQIHQPFDIRRGLRQPRDRRHQDNFLHPANCNRVVGTVEPESHKLQKCPFSARSRRCGS